MESQKENLCIRIKNYITKTQIGQNAFVPTIGLITLINTGLLEINEERKNNNRKRGKESEYIAPFNNKNGP